MDEVLQKFQTSFSRLFKRYSNTKSLILSAEVSSTLFDSINTKVGLFDSLGKNFLYPCLSRKFLNSKESIFSFGFFSSVKYQNESCSTSSFISVYVESSIPYLLIISFFFRSLNELLILLIFCSFSKYLTPNAIFL